MRKKRRKRDPLSNLMGDHRTERRRGRIRTWRQLWNLATCPSLLSWSLLSWQQLVSNLSEHKGEDCEWPLAGGPLRSRQDNGSLPPSGPAGDRRLTAVKAPSSISFSSENWSGLLEARLYFIPFHLSLLFSLSSAFETVNEFCTLTAFLPSPSPQLHKPLPSVLCSHRGSTHSTASPRFLPCAAEAQHRQGCSWRLPGPSAFPRASPLLLWPCTLCPPGSAAFGVNLSPFSLYLQSMSSSPKTHPDASASHLVSSGTFYPIHFCGHHADRSCWREISWSKIPPI